MFKSGDIVTWIPGITIMHLAGVHIEGPAASKLLNTKKFEIYKDSEGEFSFIMGNGYNWYIKTEWLRVFGGSMDDTRAYLEAVASYV